MRRLTGLSWQGMRHRLQRSDGFTLIELIVVMAIIVVLAGMSMVQYQNTQKRAMEATLREDLFRMRDAIDQYYADRNKYPATLQDLVTEHYIRTIPKDPFTESTETWQTVPAEPDPSNPGGDLGIYDVKSGADGTALDGTKYSDW